MLDDNWLKEFDAALRRGRGATEVAHGMRGSAMMQSNRPSPVHLRGLCGVVKKAFFPGLRDMQRGTSSRSIGTLIHRHVYHQVECDRAGKCDCSVRTPDNPNTQARRLLQVIQDKGWVPVRSELAVSSPTISVATRVDLICLNPATGRLVLVSWKTGYMDIEAQMQRSSSSGDQKQRMLSPLHGIEETHRQKNQVQLLCEYLILVKEYNLDIECALVVYIRCNKKDANRVIIDEAESWWWKRPETRTAVWNALQDDVQRWRH